MMNRESRGKGMEVLVARHSGFCPGVKRAIRMAEKLLENRGKAWSLGPVIHNPRVVRELEEKGLEILPADPRLWDELELEGEAVLIRSHGIGPALLEELQRRGAEVVDATCPKVRRAQRVDEDLVRRGYHLVIVGNPEHPEVAAIVEGLPHPPTVLSSPEKAAEWAGSASLPTRVAVTAQTTAGEEVFRRIVELLASRIPEMKVVDTLCEVTKRRQREAAELARRADMVIVVGGRNSSNTRQLARIALECGSPVMQVEKAEELDESAIEGKGRIAVMGGASTPKEEVDKVVRRLEGLRPRR